MSRQDTKAPGSDKSKPDYHEGPRATPMRQVLLDPNKTEQEQFALWRQAMSPSLDDSEVLDMMNTAKQNLVQFHTPKPRRKASQIKEQIAKMRPLLKEATIEQQYRMLKLMKEAYELQEKMKMGATIEPIEEDDVMAHVAKDLTGKGAPIAKLRAARDKEQMKKRERSDGLPVEPKFDYLDEK